jgi:hypothetical protein
MTIASGEIATKAALNGVGQKPRDQIRNVVDVFVNYGVKSAPDPRQVRGVEHEEPEVSDRNTADAVSRWEVSLRHPMGVINRAQPEA